MLDDRTVENEYDYLHNFPYQAIDVNGNIVFIPIIVAAVAVGALSGCSSLASYDPVNSEKNYVLSYEELYPLKAGVCGGFGEQIQWKHTDIPKGKYGIIAQTVKYSDVEFYIAGSNVNQKDKLTYGVTEFTEYWEIQYKNV